MRSRNLIILTMLILLIGASSALSATLTMVPTKVPKGAWVNGSSDNANDSYYWQQLTFTLTATQAAANPAFTITLPIGMHIADVDNTVADQHLNFHYIINDADDVGGHALVGISYTANAAGDVWVLQSTGPDLVTTDIIYLMFPVETDLSPATGPYEYAIDGANGAGNDIATDATSDITYYDQGYANFSTETFVALMTGNDDTTSTYGEVWPEAGGLFSSALDDFVTDLTDNANDIIAESAVLGLPVLDLDGTNSDETDYYVWASSDSAHVWPAREGALPVILNATGTAIVTEANTTVTSGIASSNLPEGDYFFYLTSALTGDFPLARSGMVNVRHYPEVKIVGWDENNDTVFNETADADDADVTLDTGDYFGFDNLFVEAARQTLDVYIDVDDYDDDAQILLYYASSSSLTSSSISVTGSTVDSLQTATLLADTLYESQENLDGFVKWSLDITATRFDPYLASGDYWLYVVANDGKHQTISVSKGSDDTDTEKISVKHSPGLEIDSLDPEYNLGTDVDENADVTIDVQKTDVIMLSWGKGGPGNDTDLDDSCVISFYIDYDGGTAGISATPLTDGLADYGSNDATDLENDAATYTGPNGIHLIKSGLLEDPETQSNSYYAWNLLQDVKDSGWKPYDQTQNQGTAALATSADFYHIYAIISENKSGGTKRVVALGQAIGDRLTLLDDIDDIDFENTSNYVNVYDPAVKGREIGGDETYRINFDAFDYDSGAKIAVFLLATDATIGGVAGPMMTYVGDTTIDNGLHGAGAGNSYILTSQDGDLEADGGGFEALAGYLGENTDTYYDLTLKLPSDGAASKYTNDLDDGGNVALSDAQDYYVYIGLDDHRYKQAVLTCAAVNTFGAAGNVTLATGDWIFQPATGATGIVTVAVSPIEVEYTGVDFDIDNNGGNIQLVADPGNGVLITVEGAVTTHDDFNGNIIPVYRAPGILKIIDGELNDTAPQKNLMIGPSNITVSLGDSTTVLLQVADQGNAIDLVDMYVAVEKDYFDIVDSSSPATLGTEAAYVAGGRSLLANEVIDDSTNNRWIVHATIFNASSPIVVTDVDLGTVGASFQVVSKGTSNAEEASSSIYFVNEPGAGWVTKYSNDGSDVPFSVTNCSVNVQPRGIVEGIVTFQGRQYSNYEVTFELRERDSYEPEYDATFYSTNGGDANDVGLPYMLDTNGKFTLEKVPTGDWDLIVKYDRYLSKSQQLTIVPGLDTLFVNFGTLLGGDCIGYTDSLNDVYPNNRIGLNDVNRISSAYLSTPDSTKWASADSTNGGKYNYKWADINEDNVVGSADLTMATTNYTGADVDGAQPVFAKPAVMPVASNLDALVSLMNQPTDIILGNFYTFQVVVQNAADVLGYTVDLNYDTSAFSLNAIEKGDFISSDSHSFPVVADGKVSLVNSVFGMNSYAGDGILAEISFTAKRDGVFSPDMLGLAQASFVNSAFLEEKIVMNAPTGIGANEVPVEFSLTQNFPNPFNPTTTIHFAVPNDGAVSLNVYDILGRKVTTLVDGAYSAGSYNVMWDATDGSGNIVSNGVYFYTIKSGNFKDTKRMLLLK